MAGEKDNKMPKSCVAAQFDNAADPAKGNGMLNSAELNTVQRGSFSVLFGFKNER